MYAFVRRVAFVAAMAALFIFLGCGRGSSYGDRPRSMPGYPVGMTHGGVAAEAVLERAPLPGAAVQMTREGGGSGALSAGLFFMPDGGGVEPILPGSVINLIDRPGKLGITPTVPSGWRVADVRAYVHGSGAYPCPDGNGYYSLAYCVSEVQIPRGLWGTRTGYAIKVMPGRNGGGYLWTFGLQDDVVQWVVVIENLLAPGQRQEFKTPPLVLKALILRR